MPLTDAGFAKPPLIHSRPFLSVGFKEGSTMAGHSKWANIQHRKGRQDAKRATIWTKVIREVQIAARDGGGDPSMNSRLRLALDKARLANVPKDKVQGAIARGTGTAEGQNLEEVRYEGYGVGGAALMIDCVTDNRTRTVAEVRHALAKHGGNLGTDGSVAFQFKHCGQFVFAPGASEERIMEAALEAGADDVQTHEDGSIEVICAPGDFSAVNDALARVDLKPEVAEVTMKPLSENPLADADGEKMQKLLDALDDLDDVQAVYTTAVIGR